MLEVLFGNKAAVSILLYLEENGEGYANQISRHCNIPLNMVQKQLSRFERGGVLIALYRGRSKLFRLNQKYPFYPELKRILKKGVSYRAWFPDKDPADGTDLSYKERLQLTQDLSRQAAFLNRHPPASPFAKSFGSFKNYEIWKEKQKNPRLF